MKTTSLTSLATLAAAALLSFTAFGCADNAAEVGETVTDGRTGTTGNTSGVTISDSGGSTVRVDSSSGGDGSAAVRVVSGNSVKVTVNNGVATVSGIGTVEMKIKNRKFGAPDLTIDKGTTVRWTNDDSEPHTVTSNDTFFDSLTLGNGESFDFTFNEAGTYDYSCTIHPSMTGRVVVK